MKAAFSLTKNTSCVQPDSKYCPLLQDSNCLSGLPDKVAIHTIVIPTQPLYSRIDATSGHDEESLTWGKLNIVKKST